MTKKNIGFNEAFHLTLAHSSRIGIEVISVVNAAGRMVAEDVTASVDSPSVDVSLKDGYAVISDDISKASKENPVKLNVIDSVAAGENLQHVLKVGETIRILTGAPLPEGAQAVLTEEFTSIEEEYINAYADANPGRNVLKRGADVKKGQLLIPAGIRLSPQGIGLLIAGGVSEVTVCRRPKIGLLATGSEIIMPGQPMVPGRIYASNVCSQKAWLKMLGFDVRVLCAIDSVGHIAEAMADLCETCDTVITSGGAWKGDRDLIANVIESLGGELIFHRLRLGPGKATGMGAVNNRPVFCLPGGPSSNMFGFVMIVLPAVFKMSGFSSLPYNSLKGTLLKGIFGQKDWTNLVQCEIIKKGPDIVLNPAKQKSRLIAMAANLAIVVIPEGVEKIMAGDSVPFICLDDELLSFRI